MKRGEIHPAALVNLKRLEGLREIKDEPKKGIDLGALTSISSIEQSSLIQSSCPVLAQAASLLGSPSIRNMATLGGNVGRASPASDMIPSLIVLGASVAIDGPRGKKVVGIEQLFLGPGKTILSSGEVITSFFIPEMEINTGAAYLKLGRTAGMDCCLAGVGTLLTVSRKKDELKVARVALSAVAPIPLRVKKAEEVLLSGPLNPERIDRAAQVTADESSPISDIRASASYRKEMVRVFARRAFSAALKQAQGG
jgi:carbon-monoxide dehydrogenase medium subunit